MPESSILTLLLVVAVFLLVVAVVAIIVLVVRYSQLQSHINELVQQEFAAWRSREFEAARAQLSQAALGEARLSLERWQSESEANIRADAIKRSLAVVSGKVTEHLAPYIGVFPYNPKDVRFLGTPVDLIVFDGMSEDALREIIFLEVKSGSSSLSTRERRVRDAILGKQVAWREFRVGE